VARLDTQRANAVGLGAEIGPVLVAAAAHNQSTWTMRWDLSDIPPAEFPRASRIWNELLSRPPEQWQSRANRVQWRETARAFLIRYGEPLEGALGSRAAHAEVSRAQVRYVIVR
jgi:hypothetical protein